MKHLARLVIASTCLVALSACGASPSGPGVEDSHSPTDSTGYGITYNGKMGYDYGGGLVQPFNGSAPSLGYGF